MQFTIMARGYQTEEIKEKLVNLLSNSKTGLSGLEVSERLEINRITTTKYLNIFAAEGLIKQKNIGNVNLWFIEDGTEKFHFPEDFFKVKTKYIEYLTARKEHQVYNLVRNSFHSTTQPIKIITEIIVPAIESIYAIFDQGKIGKSELNFLEKIISNSIQIINLENFDVDRKKNIILISADYQSTLLSEAASASFHADGWQVYSLGNMSSSIDVLFDLDLQKLLTKVWKPGTGIMVIVVFSSTSESMKFFAESVNSIKAKSRRNLYLAVCGDMKKNAGIKADLVEEDIEAILQWSQTTFESSIS
uniref:Putative transcriptional regulator n=1 Tax=uncultured marine thaumarchaeote AD1000_05_B01 TaxID=1455883 RepID=A0A075FHA3_9ARCH|nr:putative transcriptional regulator [uncultured marine thaumarchaeote AD1000_05_B01]